MRMEMYFRLTSWSPRNTRYYSASQPEIISYRAQCTDQLCRVKVCAANDHYDGFGTAELYVREAEITVDGHVTLGEERLIREVPLPNSSSFCG